MIERGGRLRLVPIRDTKREIIEPLLDKHVSRQAILQTDEHPTYYILGKEKFAGHRSINHSISYALGENHTNCIENAFSLLKRGIYGTFHKVSIKHLSRYCNEFSYRFNRRKAQLQMFDSTLKNLTRGKALPYSKLTASPVSAS